MAWKVIVVDHNDVNRDVIVDAFIAHNFSAFGVSNCQAALNIISQERPQLFLIDFHLPECRALDLFRTIISKYSPNHIPTIFMGNGCEEIDRITAFEFGADDFVNQPVNPKELVLRSQALLRRCHPKRNVPPYPNLEIYLEHSALRIWFNGSEIKLSSREFRILQHLLDKPGDIVSRKQLLSVGWNTSYVRERSVDATIMRLRAKLGAHGHRLRTVRGIGYRWDFGEPKATLVHSLS